jgi:hypothetical protein
MMLEAQFSRQKRSLDFDSLNKKLSLRSLLQKTEPKSGQT